MHAQKIQFNILENNKYEQQVDLIYTLLGSWMQNGQILGNQSPIAKTDESFNVFVNTPELGSLNGNNYKHVNDGIIKLAKYGLSTPLVTNLGIHPDTANVCACKKCKSYILYTTFISIDSPLRCGDCFGIIPLYRIPQSSKHGYYDILSWQGDYQSCDSLQMGCRIGERFALNQLKIVNSPLTRDGLRVCKNIEKLTQIPTYYYLYKDSARSYKEELGRKCPNCKNDWIREKPLFDLFDFQCNNCMLLSNIAFEYRV